MKYALSLLINVSVILLSCEKAQDEVVPVSLEGSWKMVTVADIPTGVIEYKPESIRGDVIISFVRANASGGSFTGNTPSNVFGPDEYLLSSGNTLMISRLTITKVAESNWGNLFIENIRNTSKVRLEFAELLIETPAKLFRFQRN
jgi:hypothetical protein